MTTGYICDRCGATFTDGGKWLQGGYHGSTVIGHWWDLCPDCMEGFTGWMERGLMAEAPEESADCVSLNDGERATADREHSLESESVRERRYESQDVTGNAERVTDGGEMSHDTREKLEEDVRTYMFPWRVDMALDWLDRQAAITERETKLRELYRFEENHREHVRSIEAVNQELNAKLADARESLEAAWEDNAELGEQVDALTTERDQWRDAYEDSERMRLELVEQVEYYEALIARLKQRRGELMEQVRKLQDDAARARREA